MEPQEMAATRGDTRTPAVAGNCAAACHHCADRSRLPGHSILLQHHPPALLQTAPPSRILPLSAAHQQSLPPAPQPLLWGVCAWATSLPGSSFGSRLLTGGRLGRKQCSGSFESHCCVLGAASITVAPALSGSRRLSRCTPLGQASRRNPFAPPRQHRRESLCPPG